MTSKFAGPKKANQKTAEPFLPERLTLPGLAEAAETCRGCDLYKNATQTVFGEGRETADIVLVGEQPGDQEDKEGQPFVGPAGRMLNEILEAAGIERSDVYLTNAVKHFKFNRSGKRRLHQKPNATEITACKPWLAAELKVIKPKIIVCMGATAARAVFGKVVTISGMRGEFHETVHGKNTYVTTHPSALLRIPDREAKKTAIKNMIADFKKIKSYLSKLKR
jgi:uracil-DNA glycosylase